MRPTVRGLGRAAGVCAVAGWIGVLALLLAPDRMMASAHAWLLMTAVPPLASGASAVWALGRMVPPVGDVYQLGYRAAEHDLAETPRIPQSRERSDD